MPTLKKYKPMLACEDYVQRCTSHSTQSATTFTTIPFKDSEGYGCDGLDNQTSKLEYNQRYLIANSVSASTDDYDVEDYKGTLTGSCTFATSLSTQGIVYSIQFTASETTTVKCFKFFRTLTVHGSGYGNKSCLMYAIYLDEPLQVTNGQLVTISVNFLYDDVTAIVL